MSSKEHRRKIRKMIQDYKEFVGCVDCKVKHPHYILDFDHLPGTTDTMKVSRAVEYSITRVIEEMLKCEVVCANCHRVRTYDRGQNYRGAESRNGTSTHRH